MKKLTVLATALSFLSLPVIAMADPYECDPSAGMMHCSFFTGSNAKIIQITPTITGNGVQMQLEPQTFCLNHYGIYVDRSFVDAGIAHVGDTFKLEFKQCSNKECSETIPLTTETFVITQAQDGYSSTPPTFTGQFNDQFGESCGPAKDKRPVLHVAG